MKAVFRKAAAVSLAAVLGCMSLTGCGSKKIDGTKTVLTVDDTTVPLGTAGFLTKVDQAQSYYQQEYYYQMLYYYYGYNVGDMSEVFDTVDSTDSENRTYGEELKDQTMEALERMVVISGHADDYDVSLTDDEKSRIDSVAQSTYDANSEICDKVGATKDNIVEALTYRTIQSKMMDPMVADVDTDVTDEEAQQTTVTYVSFENPTTDITSSTESAESSVDSNLAEVEEPETVSSEESPAESAVSSAESLAESGLSAAESMAESGVTSAEEMPDASEDTEEAAEEVLKAILDADDPATADMDSIASSINSDYSATNGQFTTNDPTDTTLDSAIVEAVQGLEDGTVVDHVVESSDGTYYYVVRLDKNFDEDATETKKDTIISERKTDAYNDLCDEWVSDAKITVDEDVWAEITVSDSDPITMKTPETETETTSDVESTASDTSSIAEDVLSAPDSGAESTAEDAASSAESD